MSDSVTTRAKNTERPKSKDIRPLLQALPYFKPYTRQLSFAFICLIVAAVAALGMPVAIRYVIDYGFSSQHVQSINEYFISLLALAMTFAVFAALRYYAVMWIGERFVADIRSKVFEHVIDLSPEFYETTSTGEVLSRLTTDTTLVQSVFGAGLSIALRSLVMLIGAVIMLFFTSAKLTALIFLLVPFVVLPVLLYGKKVRRLSRTNQDLVADSSGLANETLNAIQVIQAFTLEKFQGSRFAASVEASFNAARKRLLVSAILSGTIVLSAFAAIVIVLWLGARSVIEGSLSAGILGQFLLYATIVAGSTTALGEVWANVQRAAGAMERLMELLHAGSDIKVPEHPVPVPENQGKLVMDNITFFYPSRPEQAALDSFTLEVDPGETVALVGPSGAGKSTVFQLLLRFYEPQRGKILLNGIDIQSADPVEVRQRIGIVPQDTILFAGTALDNIRYGRPEASAEEVMAAARAASADDFIRALPQGYDTFLGEKGVRLSGGQQQRIAIARAILKNPPVLLLDEATNALDAESERLVQEALEHLMKGRTTIIIAHRLATVKRVDRIIVMAEGKILEEGTHQKLLANNGLYARLAGLQFSSINEDQLTPFDAAEA